MQRNRLLPSVKWLRRVAVLQVALAFCSPRLLPLDEKAFVRMLQSRHGKVVLVDFWATWCDPCREELPKLVALSKKLNPRKFELVTVSADEPENEAAVASVLDKEGAGPSRFIKHANDDQVFIDSIDKQWSGALPALFLYDAAGNRIASFIGESDPAEIEAAVRKALR